MTATVLLFVSISYVAGRICRDVLCGDQCAANMEVIELKYNLSSIKSTFVESRVLKSIYFRKKGFSDIYDNPSRIEFELHEYSFGEGYEFKQGNSQIIPVACLRKMKISDHISLGQFVSEFDLTRDYEFDEREKFFHAHSTELSEKFICSGSGFKSSQCSVIETKWICEIPYEGKLLNNESDCECANVSGKFVRHTDFSTMVKVTKKRNGFEFD